MIGEQYILLWNTQGVRPALRTLNTLMIACNTCNEPEEALRVYETLVLPHFSPNETTFNALISVYGKLGNLHKVRHSFPSTSYLTPLFTPGLRDAVDRQADVAYERSERCYGDLQAIVGYVMIERCCGEMKRRGLRRSPIPYQGS